MPFRQRRTFEDRFKGTDVEAFVRTFGAVNEVDVAAALGQVKAGRFVGSVVPFVNDGRWLVQCECKGAQVASRESRWFICVDCGAGPFEVKWDG